jgi:hypothetical protein
MVMIDSCFSSSKKIIEKKIASYRKIITTFALIIEKEYLDIDYELYDCA